MTAQSILDGNFGEREHRALSTLETSMAQAAHTVYERNSQCAGVLSEISPTLVMIVSSACYNLTYK